MILKVKNHWRCTMKNGIEIFNYDMNANVYDDIDINIIFLILSFICK